MSIATRIKMIRMDKGLTVQELADRVGASHSLISKMERGDRTLSPRWLQKIATALETTPENLIGTGEAANDGLTKTLVTVVDNVLHVTPYNYQTLTARENEWGMDPEHAMEFYGLRPEYHKTVADTDEMNRVIPKGSMIAFELTDEAEAGDIVLVRYAGGVHLRRFLTHPLRFEGECWSREVETIFPAKSYRIIGKVVCYGGQASATPARHVRHDSRRMSA